MGFRSKQKNLTFSDFENSSRDKKNRSLKTLLDLDDTIAWDEVETAKKCIDKGAGDYFVKGRNKEMLKKNPRSSGHFRIIPHCVPIKKTTRVG